MEELTQNTLSFLINEPIYIIPENEGREAVKKTEPTGGGILIYTKELSGSDRAFLTKVLSAVGLSLEDVKIEEGKIKDDHFNCSVILSFGIPVSGASLYQPDSNSGKTFLSADPISTIQNDVNLKKQLWGALQKVFAAK